MIQMKSPTIKRTSLYGDLDHRFLAFLIDSTFMVFLHSLLAYFWIGMPEELTQEQEFLNFHIRHILTHLHEFTNLALVVVIFVVVQWLYFALMESSERQASIGKLAVGLKVTNLKGKPVRFWQASARYFAKLLSFLPLGGGFLLAFYTPRKQALHDLITKCLVLQR
jgi:uncharacterized RDD family membrane protein YckC